MSPSFEKRDKLGENLVPRARPRYQGPLQNPPMRIKRVTALAYPHQLEEQKMKNQVALEHFYGKGK